MPPPRVGRKVADDFHVVQRRVFTDVPDGAAVSQSARLGTYIAAGHFEVTDHNVRRALHNFERTISFDGYRVVRSQRVGNRDQ